ncbi:MAG: polyprenyl synthetase family protein [Acidobacteriota bacterium]|nr:polyprenyl synthetase family protein [Acidobacteriota bacterium]
MGSRDWIASQRVRAEEQLAATLADMEDDACDELLEAMRYAVHGGGKRLRPLLVLASCACVESETSAALPAAVAVELIHAYSLVHDDLPAMDDDDVRRGKPAVHVRFGEATAILVGDALQSLAFQALASGELPAERVRRQVAVLARAAGASGMAGGQSLDLRGAGQPADERSVERIHRLKTGALISASFRLGAIAGAATPSTEETFDRVGRKVGLAFQIQDDVLDATASTERLGKTAGKDVAAGKATWPAVVGLDDARRRATALVDAALSELSPFAAAAEPLRQLARLAVDRLA